MAAYTLQQLFEQRLETIAQYYRQGDLSLGYRRLMDAALDTGDTQVFNAVAAHTEWLETEQPDDATNWTRAAVLLEQINAAGVQAKKTVGEEIMNAQQIRKTYSGGNFSLGPVDIDLRRGELLGLVGENGNGKTTLLRVLAGELRYDSGNIDYHLPQSGNPYDLRSQLAYIPQRTPKWFGPLKDNLKFTLSSYDLKGAANEAYVLMYIARMGLWKYRNLDWNQLSSGYKMRFELARTFLRRPDILLLDEPLANLDVLAQQTILEDLKTLSDSLSTPMAVVLSSQQLYEVEKVSDKVLFLKSGQPMWQDNTTAAGTDVASAETAGLIVEFDTDAGREQLQSAFAHLPLEKINFNG
ncbi:MAG TPA: ABC transporter ATP-binding protein, partial [Chitinophagaceae bacterium]|nr:ABC transporter ATP-binding protein [Chitinophagaceae bacterium]